MLEFSQGTPRPHRSISAGVVSTFPPTRCGIARFASTFIEAMTQADRTIDFEVVRLRNQSDSHVAAHPVVMEIDPNIPVSIRAAARRLSGYDIAVLQHEFGIYGDDHGRSVLDLVAAIDTARLVVLHTVLPEPSPEQLQITRELARQSTLVVLCESAARLLEERYDIPSDDVRVIHHGTTWTPQAPNVPPRRHLITWGLLGEGKGIERALEAIAELDDLDPPVFYRIVGRTHPVVAARSGSSYRSYLEGMVRSLGLSDNVEFIDRYVADDELFDLVRRSDLVVVPYDNKDQVSSGVIAEGIGLGRPVVATRFPYSEEMLGSGAGAVVDHDPRQMAEAIRTMLEDPISYRRAVREAKSVSEQLSWHVVADRYAALMRRLVSSVATA